MRIDGGINVLFDLGGPFGYCSEVVEHSSAGTPVLVSRVRYRQDFLIFSNMKSRYGMTELPKEFVGSNSASSDF